MEKPLWETENFDKSYEQKQYTTRDTYKMLKKIKFNTILDIGCARAGLLKALNIPQGRYTGFDISKTMTRQNKKQYPKANFDAGNIINLPYNDNSFDVVVCSDVLIHVTNWKQALDECLRVAKHHTILVIRNKWGRTKHALQKINAHVVPYNIFGKDFWNYLEHNDHYWYTMNTTSFLNPKKCIKYFFPVWTTTVLIKVKP